MVVLSFICEIPTMVLGRLTVKKCIWLWAHFVWLKPEIGQSVCWETSRCIKIDQVSR